MSSATSLVTTSITSLAVAFATNLFCSHTHAQSSWTDTGTLNEARVHHTATLLEDGTVLVTGGQTAKNSGDVHFTAEVYDPEAETWSLVGEMTRARTQHRAARLSDGRVLIFEGTSAEIYDPDTKTFSEAAGPREPRYLSAMIALDNNRVLVVGGVEHPRVRASAEIYDANEDTWTYTQSMREARWNPAWTRLPDGRVLVTGGADFGEDGTDSLKSAEVFDPQQMTWSLLAPMRTGRALHTLAALENGEVVAVGGDGGWNETSFEVYDPSRDRWESSANPVPIGPRFTRATRLTSGVVLFTGGERNHASSAQLYLPWSRRLISMPSTTGCGTGSTATRLQDGRVLVTGGNYANNVSRRAIVLSLAALGEPCSDARSCESGLCEMQDGGMGVCAAAPALPTHNPDGGITSNDGGLGADGGLDASDPSSDADESGCSCRTKDVTRAASSFFFALAILAWRSRRA